MRVARERVVLQCPSRMRAVLHVIVLLVFVATLPGVLAAEYMSSCVETAGMSSGAGSGSGDHGPGECPDNNDRGACEDDSSEDDVSSRSHLRCGSQRAPILAVMSRASRLPPSLVPSVPHRPPIA